MLLQAIAVQPLQQMVKKKVKIKSQNVTLKLLSEKTAVGTASRRNKLLDGCGAIFS